MQEPTRDAIATRGVTRAALAMAEAIVPGGFGADGADEATVRRAEEVVGALHPNLLRAWRWAQGVLDAAAIARGGRPFHALTADAQDALLRRWEDDSLLRRPLGLIELVYKLVHFDALGEPRAAAPHPCAAQRWARQATAGDDWPSQEIECDVVVVGSGAGGAVVGAELARRGLAVLFLEEGDLHGRDAFDGSAVRAHQRFYRAAVAMGNAPMPLFVGRMVGGSTAINGGTCFRTPPWVLERWCEALGTGEFAPAAMAPYFERVESVLQVHPVRPEIIGPIGALMARGCGALGWSHAPLLRNAPDCDGSGFCDFGCARGARRSMDVSYLPEALGRGAVLLHATRFERVWIEGGRAVGVEARTRGGRRLRARARAVVLAAGAIPTPLLLLAQGIANRSGQVGRNLTVHPSCGVSALFDEPVEGHRYVPQGYGCDEFLREGILITTAQPSRNLAPLLFPFGGRRLMATLERIDRIASFALMIRDTTANGRVRHTRSGVPAITYDVQPGDATLMHRAMVRAGEMCAAAGARALYPVTLRQRELDLGAGFAGFRRARLAPGDFVWLSYHPLGTCKMGRDARTSVIGLDHQAHDIPGLYVVDGSAVPGPLGVNPQITIAAMATRAAVGIARALA